MTLNYLFKREAELMRAGLPAGEYVLDTTPRSVYSLDPVASRAPTTASSIMSQLAVTETKIPVGAASTSASASAVPTVTTFGNEFTDHYTLLDSWSKHPDSKVSSGEYVFYISDLKVSNDQGVGVTGPVVKNVVEIQIQPFYMGMPPPYPYVVNSLSDPAVDRSKVITEINYGDPDDGSFTWISSPRTQLPYDGKLLLEIAEGGRGNVSTSGGTRMTYLLTTSDAGGQTMYVRPAVGFETFVYADPIASFSSFTLRFSTPDVPVEFLPDVYYATTMSIDGAGNLVFTCPSHNLVLNDSIFISGVETKSTRINNWLNRKEGLLVGTNGLTTNTFRLNPDVVTTGEGIGAPGDTVVSAKPVRVMIAKRRMLMRLRVRTVPDKK